MAGDDVDAGVRPRSSRSSLLSFPVVGALVASRRPAERDRLAVLRRRRCSFAVATLADGWATYTLRATGGRGEASRAAWLGSWLFLPALFGTPQLLFLLFPGGRPLSPRWRWAVWLAGVAIVAQAAGAALAPGELADAPVDGLANPVGVERSPTRLEGARLGARRCRASCLAAASLVLRFRRARGDERLQLKWFVSAARRCSRSAA